MILAHGIDLVDIASTERLLAEPSGQFLARCFTESEKTIIEEAREVPARLSARFAVKEAVMKALETGFGSGIGFLDIEVETQANGAPRIQLHGAAAERARALGITDWFVSTSHEGNMAIGSVIGVGGQIAPR